MIIKKFTGKNEAEATEAAKKELGDTLVIMNVRYVKAKGPFSFLKKKKVEVTAALEDDEEPMKQIRRLAQAQVAAQEKEAFGKSSAGKMNAEKLSSATAEQDKKASGFSVGVDDSTQLSTKEQKADAATEAVKKAGNRTGLSTGGSSIERKLDNLQNLLETQINKENEARGANVNNTGKVSETEYSTDKNDSPEENETANDPKEKISRQEKEVDKFLRLLYNTMIDNEVDEHYANEIIGDAEKNRTPGATMDFILGAIYQKMILRFGKSQGIQPAQNGPKVVFFIGPTGVGKTTTIAKVASSFSVNEKKKIALLTTDTYRIAATDQLRTYAGILEVPFRVIYEPEELASAIQDFSFCDYIFVDSAGHSHRNEELLQKQKDYIDITGDTEKQIFLVLSATTKYRDLKKIADNYREISEYELIFTKLDETGEYGNLYNMRCESGAPIAYVTCGQNVPDDIEVFNAQKTVKQLLGGKR